MEKKSRWMWRNPIFLASQHLRRQRSDKNKFPPSNLQHVWGIFNNIMCCTQFLREQVKADLLANLNGFRAKNKR